MKSFILALSVFSAPAFAISEAAVFRCARKAQIIYPQERNACFMLEEADQSVILRELHGNGCPGDPNVSPARAFFSEKVDRAGRRVLGYEAGAEDWVACPR